MPNIKIKFLGVGNAFSKKYGNNSALVTITTDGVAKNLLIDCGRTVPDSLVRAGYTWADLDAIFITHIHGDHVHGLEEAGFMGRYVYNKKPHLIFPNEKIKNDLWDKVLKGTMMNGDLDRVMRFDDYFTHESVNRTEQYFDFNGVMFSVYPTFHIQNKKSYGMIIGEKNYIVYSSDSLLNSDLMEVAVKDGCQAIFHDCQFYNNEKRVHASLDDLLTLSDDTRKLTYIMHYGDDIADYYTKIKDGDLKIAIQGEVYEFEVGSYSLEKPPFLIP